MTILLGFFTAITLLLVFYVLYKLDQKATVVNTALLMTAFFALNIIAYLQLM